MITFAICMMQIVALPAIVDTLDSKEARKQYSRENNLPKCETIYDENELWKNLDWRIANLPQDDIAVLKNCQNYRKVAPKQVTMMETIDIPDFDIQAPRVEPEVQTNCGLLINKLDFAVEFCSCAAGIGLLQALAMELMGCSIL
jgi:hypothetical protein